MASTCLIIRLRYRSVKAGRTVISRDVSGYFLGDTVHGILTRRRLERTTMAVRPETEIGAPLFRAQGATSTETDQEIISVECEALSEVLYEPGL